MTAPAAQGVRVAILALPESSASVIYGMFDLFMSAGRDWGLIVDGTPGPQVMNPQVVSSHEGPFRAGNGVMVAPDLTLAQCPPVDIVCVPELLVPPGEPIEGRFRAEIE